MKPKMAVPMHYGFYPGVGVAGDGARFKKAASGVDVTVLTPVNAFVKLSMNNVFNHQQITSWNTVSNGAASLSAPWVRKSTYGSTTTANNWGGSGFGRFYTIDLGIRF